MPTERPAMGLLERYLDECESNGWNPAADIRMQLDEDDDDNTDDDAGTDTDGDDTDDTDSDDSEVEQPDQTADEVSKLKREAAKRRTQLKPWAQLGRELNMTPEQIREALTKAGNTPDPVQAATAAAEQKAALKLVRANVKEAAVGLFADPADAALYLDLTKYEVDEDGDLVDPDELAEDLEAVLKRKPHLAAKADGGKDPKPKIKGQGRRDATITGLEAGAAKARQRFGSETATA